MATKTWEGDDDGDLRNIANWGGALPGNNDDVVFSGAVSYSPTSNMDALADVTLKISDEAHNSMFSRGVHENVNMAAIFAFINGLNRLLQGRV